MNGEQLKQWRLSHDLTQTELATLLGVGKRGYITVNEWEHGTRNMGRLYQQQMMQLLVLTTEQLRQALEEKQTQ